MYIIVLYIIYIRLTIIKCNVLTCFDYNKITGAFRPNVVHCDFAIDALRLGLGHSGRGAFRQRGIPTIIHLSMLHVLHSRLYNYVCRRCGRDGHA